MPGETFLVNAKINKSSAQFLLGAAAIGVSPSPEKQEADGVTM
jgi:hypothetical protein